MIEDLIRESLADERWDLVAGPGLMEDVRRGRAARRRRTAVATLLVGATAVVAAVGLVRALPNHDDTLIPYAAGGVPQNSPVPSISPSFVPQTGRDWLLSDRAWQDFVNSHTRPSPAPGQSVVQSPAPLGPQSQELLDDVQAASLPAGTTLRREDAVGGQPNVAAVHLTLAGGVPVEIIRSQAQEPIPYDGYADGPGAGATLVDVPGTTSAAALYPNYSYGFGPEFGQAAHAVQVVTRGGVVTFWAAPASVPLDSLKDWALAAAAHAGN